MPGDGQRPVKDILTGLLSGENALSRREVARELQRDPRMVSKIMRGETSGESYRKALSELASRGTVSTPPPRRKDKDGRIVHVRAPKSAKEKSVLPPRPTYGKYTDSKQGGRWSTKTSYMDKGGRLHEVGLPKGISAKGRADGAREIERLARSAAKGQKWGKKNVMFSLTFANGRTMEVGSRSGYAVSTFLKGVNEFKRNGGDAVGWLLSQANDRYSDLDLTKTPITGVLMQVYRKEAGSPTG